MKSDINNERIRKDCYTILFGFNKRWERVIKKKDGMTFVILDRILNHARIVIRFAKWLRFKMVNKRLRWRNENKICKK